MNPGCRLFPSNWSLIVAWKRFKSEIFKNTPARVQTWNLKRSSCLAEAASFKCHSFLQMLTGSNETDHTAASRQMDFLKKKLTESSCFGSSKNLGRWLVVSYSWLICQISELKFFSIFGDLHALVIWMVWGLLFASLTKYAHQPSFSSCPHR